MASYSLNFFRSKLSYTYHLNHNLSFYNILYRYLYSYQGIIENLREVDKIGFRLRSYNAPIYQNRNKTDWDYIIQHGQELPSEERRMNWFWQHLYDCARNLENYTHINKIFRQLIKNSQFLKGGDRNASNIHNKWVQMNEIQVEWFEFMIQGYSEVNNLDQVLEILDIMKEYHQIPSKTIILKMIKLYSKLQLFSESLSWLQQLVNHHDQPDLKDLILLLIDTARVGDIETSTQIHHIILYNNSVPPKQSWSWNVFLWSLIQHGNVEYCHNFFQIMLQENVTANILSLCLHLEILGLDKQFESIQDHFCQILDITTNYFDSDQSLLNNIFNSLLRAILSCQLPADKAIDECEGVIRYMRENSVLPDEESYQLLVDCYVRNIDIDSLITCLHHMHRRKFKSFFRYHDTLLSLYQNTNDISSAKQVYENMLNSSIEPSAESYLFLMNTSINAEDNLSYQKYLHILKNHMFYQDIPTNLIPPSNFNKNRPNAIHRHSPLFHLVSSQEIKELQFQQLQFDSEILNKQRSEFSQNQSID